MIKKIKFILAILFGFVILMPVTANTVVDTLSADSTSASDTSSVLKKIKKVKPEALTPVHWNTIKFNPTPMLLFSNVRNITLAYERMINKTQSLSIQVGYLLFPKLINDTILGLVNIRSDKKYGVNLAFDYRYYPFARNRRPAPDGLYIGGYLSYYGFSFSNHLDIIDQTVIQEGSLKGRLNVVNLGMSVGYQFIFWKRFSLDMLLMGPSYSFYQGNLQLSGNFDPEEIDDINQELVDEVLARWPALGTLFKEQTLKFQGSRNKWGMGFRYSISLGFHF